MANDNLLPLNIPPGVFRNGTAYQSAGRWRDGHLVRFVDGTIRPVGGWRRAQDPTGAPLVALAGVPRKALAWRGDTGAYRIAVGTTSKLFALKGSVVTDITPVGYVAGQANGSYSPGGATTGAGPLMATLADADTWQLDNFGDFLVGVSTPDGKLYVWQNDALPAAQAAGSPPDVRGVVVTPERYVVALGTTNNVRRVTWASQESLTDWTPTAQNTAGDFDLATTGKLMCGRRTKAGTLLFTDNDVHAMTFIGGVLVYSFEQVGSQCGIISPNAVAILDATAIWMGHRNFYLFDGYVKAIPCDVSDYVFGDFNEAQRGKVWALSVSEYGEVWWFYPSANSLTCDRYVCYSYRERHWSKGQLSRACGFDAEVTPFPVLLDDAGLLWEHEYGEARTSVPAPFLESGPVELGAGDAVMHVHRIVPDDKTEGDVSATLYTALFPDAAEVASGPYTLTQATSVRVTGRQTRVRLDEVRPVSWRVGRIRLGVKEGGRR